MALTSVAVGPEAARRVVEAPPAITAVAASTTSSRAGASRQRTAESPARASQPARANAVSGRPTTLWIDEAAVHVRRQLGTRRPPGPDAEVVAPACPRRAAGGRAARSSLALGMRDHVRQAGTRRRRTQARRSQNDVSSIPPPEDRVSSPICCRCTYQGSGDAARRATDATTSALRIRRRYSGWRDGGRDEGEEHDADRPESDGADELGGGERDGEPDPEPKRDSRTRTIMRAVTQNASSREEHRERLRVEHRDRLQRRPGTQRKNASARPAHDRSPRKEQRVRAPARAAPCTDARGPRSAAGRPLRFVQTDRFADTDRRSRPGRRSPAACTNAPPSGSSWLSSRARARSRCARWRRSRRSADT